MAPRTILLAAAHFVAGVVAGIGSLLVGPTGIALAALALALTLVRVRRHPERAGAYLLGASFAGLAIGLPIVLRMRACEQSSVGRVGDCYAPVTAPAVAIYALAGGLGALLTCGPPALAALRSGQSTPRR